MNGRVGQQLTTTGLLALLLLGVTFVAACAQKDAVLRPSNPYNSDPSQQNPSHYVDSLRMLRILNTERVRNGLSVLAWSPELAIAAQGQAEAMRETKAAALDGFEGRVSGLDFNGDVYRYDVKSAQNLFAAANQILDTPESRSMVLDPDLTHVGIGMASLKAKKYLVFGEPTGWYAVAYARNPEAYRELVKQRKWREYLRRELAGDKTLVTDLNYGLFDPVTEEERPSVRNVPEGWNLSAPALQTPMSTMTPWSAHSPAAEASATPEAPPMLDEETERQGEPLDPEEGTPLYTIIVETPQPSASPATTPESEPAPPTEDAAPQDDAEGEAQAEPTEAPVAEQDESLPADDGAEEAPDEEPADDAAEEDSAPTSEDDTSDERD